jgi:2-hydroxy-6-oxonona-2,4-dienedioate hydrolase
MALTPEQEVARIEALGEVKKTPSGDGHMVWHVWGKGPPLVLLHGTFGTWMHWIRSIEAFSKHFRVLAADMPGFGDSDLQADPSSVVSLVETVGKGVDLLTAHDEPVRYGGFSYGASMSSPSALASKRKTEAVCLIGSTGLGGKRGEPPPLKNWQGAKTPAEVSELHRHNLGALMFYDKSKIDDLAIHIQTVNTRKTRLRTRQIKDRPALNGSVERIDAKMTSIWGDHDATAHPYVDESLDMLRAARPGIRIEVLKDCGHWAPYEAVERFNPLILDMLGVQTATA